MTELLLMAVSAVIEIVKAAVRGDLTARQRLLNILGHESASRAERLLDEAAIDAKFGDD